MLRQRPRHIEPSIDVSVGVVVVPVVVAPKVGLDGATAVHQEVVVRLVVSGAVIVVNRLLPAMIRSHGVWQLVFECEREALLRRQGTPFAISDERAKADGLLACGL